MNFYQRAAALSFGLTAVVFYAIPLTILSFAAQSNFGEMIALAASFIAPLIISTLLFSGWAGRHLRKSKTPSFVMGLVSLVVASCFSVLVMMIAYPADNVHALSVHKINVGLTSAFFMVLFGVPASIIASLFFIGSCQKKQKEIEQRS